MTFRYRGYAAPQLSLDEGVQVIRHTATHDLENARCGWDDFRSYFPLYPQHSANLLRIMQLTRQACVLYMDRVASGPTRPPLFQRVEDIRIELLTLPIDTPMNHILVWTIFIAAAESSTVEQQEFFLGLLLQHHKRNGFGNIVHTINFLTRLWTKKDTRDWVDWPSLLPQLPCFVV
jgi:hypothetical protein